MCCFIEGICGAQGFCSTRYSLLSALYEGNTQMRPKKYRSSYLSFSFQSWADGSNDGLLVVMTTKQDGLGVGDVFFKGMALFKEILDIVFVL